jgi:hypothetical protein
MGGWLMASWSKQLTPEEARRIDVEFRVRNGADMRLLLREQRALTTRAAHTIIVPRAIQGGPERSWSTQCSSTE